MKTSNVEWFKSSYSTASGDCVEVAFLASDAVGVRDSKNPGPTLLFTPAEWDAFTADLVSDARPRLGFN